MLIPGKAHCRSACGLLLHVSRHRGNNCTLSELLHKGCRPSLLRSLQLKQLNQVYLPAAEKRCILEPYQVELEQVLRTLRPIAVAGANGAPEAAQMQDAARSHIQESNFASVTVGIPLLRAAPNNSTPPKRRKPSVYKVCRKCHLLPPLCAGNCVPYLCTAWNLFQINNAKRGWNKATMAAKYTEMLSTSQHDTQ